MDAGIKKQNKVFEDIYNPDNSARFNFHFIEDKVVRYLRDRRLNIALTYLLKQYGEEAINWKVLIVCGGVGGEGAFFYKAGFEDVTVSDFSENSLLIANKLAPHLKTKLLNAEDTQLASGSYHLVVVQDGLHHLPRPSTGFTEMLRVASKAIIVIEPYDSLIGKIIGTEWELHGQEVNYVFRWNRALIKQTVKCYLLYGYCKIKVFRIWDHSITVYKLAKLFPAKFHLSVIKGLYSLLSLINFTGNMMVAVISKK